MKTVFIVLLVALAIGFAPALVMAQEGQALSGKQMYAQQQKDKKSKSGAVKKGTGEGSKAMHEQCMAKHKEWQAKAEAWNTSLNDKLAAMNAAQGDQKVAAMAAVINELVTQRNEMFEKFKTHHGKMGGMGCGMMGAMKGGMGGGMCCGMMGDRKGGMHRGGMKEGGMHHGGMDGMKGGCMGDKHKGSDQAPSAQHESHQGGMSDTGSDVIPEDSTSVE